MGFNELLSKTHVRETFIEIIAYVVPLWIAFCVGLIIGWVWKPKWANSGRQKLVSSSASVSESSSSTEYGECRYLNFIFYLLSL